MPIVRYKRQFPEKKILPSHFGHYGRNRKIDLMVWGKNDSVEEAIKSKIRSALLYIESNCRGADFASNSVLFKYAIKMQSIRE